MALMQASLRFLYLGVVLGMSLASTAQTALVVVPVESQQLPKLPPVTPEVTKSLEGRLFFSPQQRLQIDTARRRGIVTGEDGQLVETPPSVLNGFVKRSDGNTAVWVDGDVRWNTNTTIVGSLSPGDVGGPSVYLKSARIEALVPPNKPAPHTRNSIKPRSNKSSKPRLLP